MDKEGIIFAYVQSQITPNLSLVKSISSMKKIQMHSPNSLSLCDGWLMTNISLCIKKDSFLLMFRAKSHQI